jgi:nitrogen-specific signal transduction histidine kinase
MAKPILLSVDDDSDVLRAIERDRGNIQVHSKPGDTRFQVWLPLAEARS